MEKITGLYRNFSRFEKRMLKMLLETRCGDNAEKYYRFLRMISGNHQVSEKEIAKKLFGKNVSAYSQFKQRLFGRMLDVILISGKERSQTNDPLELSVLIRKQMLTTGMLRERGLYELAEQVGQEQMTDRVEEAAAGMIGDLLKVNEKHAAHSWRGLQSQQGASLKKIAVLEGKIRARQSWERFQYKRNGRMYACKSLTGFLADEIQTLEKMQRTNGSAEAGFYLLCLKFYSFFYEEKMNAARAVATQLQEISENLSRDFQHLPLLLMSKVHLRNAEFHAARNLLLPLTHLHDNLPLRQEATLLYAQSCLWDNNPALAAVFLRRLDDSGMNEGSSELLALKLSTEVALAFRQKQAGGQMVRLMDAQRATQDKSGYATGIRLLEIMLLIARDEYQLACSRIEALRKHTLRHGRSERNEAQMKLLLQYEKHGMLPDHTDPAWRVLKNLFPWKPLSPEIIPFEMLLDRDPVLRVA